MAAMVSGEVQLTTLESDTKTDEIVEVMKRDGAAILRDVIPASTVTQMLAEVKPYVEGTPMGNDDFTGRKTQRTGALVARTPTCRDLVLNPAVLATARSFLGPFAERIILHLTQTINIHPGQGKQTIHRDRLAWGTHLPLSIEPQFNTIWALTDFSEENGATRVVPGSAGWGWERHATPEESCQAVMSAGSVLLYSGSVLHSGGENRSAQARMGLNITYCLGWLRQEENQYLSCPPHIAKTLAPELQELLGYTMGNYALGYYSDPEASIEESGIQLPERAVGRGGRAGLQFSADEAGPDIPKEEAP
jgi:ectoine hydroxylase-related dioxygenase (phytanoyl-CoA dioxygenase family)